MEPSDLLSDPDLFPGLLDHLGEALYLVDRERRIVYWNAAAERVTGYLRQEVTGRFCHSDILLHCDEKGTPLCGTSCPLQSVMRDGKPCDAMVFLRHKHGHRVAVNVRGRAVHNASGEIVGAMELFQPCSAIDRTLHQDLVNSGCVDGASGAMSRVYGELRLRQHLLAVDTLGGTAGWLRVSLCDAEPIAGRFGYAAVEAALRLVGRTLNAAFRQVDAVSRWEESEFRVLIVRTDADEILRLTSLIEGLVRSSEFEWWGEPVRVRVETAGTAITVGDSLETIERRVGAGADGHDR